MAKFSAARSLVLAATVSAMTLATTGCSDPVSGAVLGVVLDGLMTDVQETVDEAQSDVKDIVGNAGSTLALAIDSIRADYEDALDTTIDKLDRASTLKIHELERVVQDFTNAAVETVHTLARQGQQIANTIPFANTAPQVTDFSPRMIGLVPSEATFQLRVSGNFHSTLPEGEQPRLLIGGQPLDPPPGAITNEVIFDVPTALLPASGDATITTTSFRLEVPYKSPVLKFDKVGTFNLLVSVLPRSVGTFTLERRQPREYTITSDRLTWPANGVPCGVDADGDDGDRRVLCAVTPTPGWHIDTKTVTWELADARGSDGDYWTVTMTEQSTARVAYELWADDHSAFYLDGKIYIFIRYSEWRTETRTEVSPPTSMEPPAWGTEVAIPFELDETLRLVWKRFDGRSTDIVGNYNASPFLRVTVDGRWWRISAVVPTRTVATAS